MLPHHCDKEAAKHFLFLILHSSLILNLYILNFELNCCIFAKQKGIIGARWRGKEHLKGIKRTFEEAMITGEISEKVEYEPTEVFMARVTKLEDEISADVREFKEKCMK